MNNKFERFLKDFTDVSTTMKTVDVYIGKTKGDFRSNTHGNDSLAMLFHENIQQAVQKVITSSIAIKPDEVLLNEEYAIKEDLLEKMIYNLEKNSTIKEDSDLNETIVANYFIDNLYVPLLNMAKEISLQFNHT